MMKKICLIFLLNLTFFLYSAAPALEIRLLFYQGDGKNLTREKNHFQIQNNKFRFQNKTYIIQNDKFLKIPENYPLVIKNIDYFGKIKIVQKKGTYFLINYLPLELYLEGVLAGEISYSWPNAAIKAQAIASRSYAVYLMKKRKNEIFDIVNSESNQVFKGVDSSHPNIKKNVLATKDVIMTYRNEPIQTFFSATCGGMTEKAEDVWSSDKKLAYFKNIRCHYCTTHPKFNWDYQINNKTLTTKLMAKLGIKKVKRWEIVERSGSKRVKKIMVVDEKNKKHFLSGNELRVLLNPAKVLSTKFKLTKRNNKYHFKGTGFGHGVGLCQWGAKTMAERGFSHKRILNFYYKNITIKPINSRIYLALK